MLFLPSLVLGIQPGEQYYSKVQIYILSYKDVHYDVNLDWKIEKIPNVKE